MLLIMIIIYIYIYMIDLDFARSRVDYLEPLVPTECPRGSLAFVSVDNNTNTITSI